MSRIVEIGEDKLEGFRGEWTELFAACKDSTPFQHPEWIIPWWRNFGGSTFKMAAFYDSGVLAGLAPVFIYRAENGIRRACFTGTGISDYLNIMASCGNEKRFAMIFSEYLAEISDQWDECDLQDIPEGSALLLLDFSREFLVDKGKWNVCPYLELPVSPGMFEYCFPKKLRKNIRAVSRELSRSGGFRIEIAEKGQLNLFLSELFRLHEARWASKHQHGVLDGEMLKRFYIESAPGLLESGLLRLYLLRFRDKAIAGYYVLSTGDRAYAYLGGFDPSFSDFSPGALALFHVIKDSLGRGAKIFDFMRGGEAYKYYWGPKEKHNYRIVIRKRKV